MSKGCFQSSVGNTVFYSTINCLEKLRNFLLYNNTAYSAEEANRWFRDTGPYPKGYQSALFRLQDVFNYGKIQPVNAFPVSFPYYSHLQGLWKKEMDDYLATLVHTEASLTQIRNGAARFLYRIQVSGSDLMDNMKNIALAPNTHKFVLNFWVENLRSEYERIKSFSDNLTKIKYVCNVMPYYYFQLTDPESNVIEVTGAYTPMIGEFDE